MTRAGWIGDHAGRMLYSTDSLRVDAADGTATLWLGFPGPVPNRLDAARILELEPALDAVFANPFLERLVVRSAHLAGFSAGTSPGTLAHLETDADRRLYAEIGQAVLAKLADAPLTTVAFLDGPCLGSGLELALACDYRLAVAGPDTFLGLPDATCWGGRTRLRRQLGRRSERLIGHTVTAKEAVRLGLVDVAFSARRAKIELQTFLNELRPRRRTRWFAPPVGVGLAAERSQFAASFDGPTLELAVTAERVEPRTLPAVVGLVGSDERTATLAGELAIRGVRVVVAPGETPFPDGLREPLARGRVTPLERDQAAARIRATHSWDGFAAADWVIVTDPDVRLLEVEAHVGRRTRIAVTRDLGEQPLLDRPGRALAVGFTANGTVEVGRGPHTDPAAAADVTGWLRRLGYTSVGLTAHTVPVAEQVRAAVWDEAVRLVAEGLSIRAVDAAAAGILPTPLAGMDRHGLAAVARTVPRVRPLVAAGLTGEPDGFYHRPADAPPVPNLFAQVTLWDSAQRPALVPSTEYRVPSTEQAAERLALRAVNAAAACLADERYAGPAEIDLAAGRGGPVFASAGGPLRHADARGLAAVVRAMRKLGGRFAPHPELARRAAGREGFHDGGPVRDRRAA